MNANTTWEVKVYLPSDYYSNFVLGHYSLLVPRKYILYCLQSFIDERYYYCTNNMITKGSYGILLIIVD